MAARRIALILLAVPAAIGVVVLGIAPALTQQTVPATQTSAAPLPRSPQNGLVFIDSDLALEWDWQPPLADNQVFALHLWYEDEPLQEVWTPDTTYSAQQLIDSYSRDVGNFHWQVAVIEVSADKGFEKMASEWSAVQRLQRVRRFIPTPLPPSEQSDLARFVESQRLSSYTETIDYVRHFIYTNADRTDQPIYAPDYSDALDMLLAYSQNQGEPPKLLCDGVSTSMSTLLSELGVESRLVFLYGEARTNVFQHTMLDVFNPDTQRWEIHDSLYERYYVDIETNERVDGERLLFGSFRTIAACDYNGACSQEWAREFRRYFGVIRYGYTDTYWVNPDRFDLSSRFGDYGNANLAEYLGQTLSRNPRDFIFRFDTWVEPAS